MNDYTMHHPKISHDIFTTFIANAITGLIVDWIKGGIKYSPQYMGEQLMEIVMLSAEQKLEKRDGRGF